MELYLRALQRYLQPNREDRQRGIASADMGAALVGGHTATSGVAQVRGQVTDRSLGGPTRHETPDVDKHAVDKITGWKGFHFPGE